jgi:hypothetical protein
MDNPHEPETQIMGMKDGRTALAYKAEYAVDMDTGAIVTVTAHGGAARDTVSIQETLPTASEVVAKQISQPTAAGEYAVNVEGVEALAEDKGYHADPAFAAVQGSWRADLRFRAGSRPAEMDGQSEINRRRFTRICGGSMGIEASNHSDSVASCCLATHLARQRGLRADRLCG